jgi:hypothetical protein
MNELEPKALRSQWLWFGGPRRADRHDDDVVVIEPIPVGSEITMRKFSLAQSDHLMGGVSLQPAAWSTTLRRRFSQAMSVPDRHEWQRDC